MSDDRPACAECGGRHIYLSPEKLCYDCQDVLDGMRVLRLFWRIDPNAWIYPTSREVS